MNSAHAVGFAPFYDAESKVLILGSFPSVKSRETSFYYGHPQNRFWKTVCSFFGEQTAQTVEEKKEFLLRRKIALWDVVIECDIVGSSDASICNPVVADVEGLVKTLPLRKILCNGKTAYTLLLRYAPALKGMATLLPSTSPANPRFTKEPWQEALAEVFS